MARALGPWQSLVMWLSSSTHLVTDPQNLLAASNLPLCSLGPPEHSLASTAQGLRPSAPPHLPDWNIFSQKMETTNQTFSLQVGQSARKA